MNLRIVLNKRAVVGGLVQDPCPAIKKPPMTAGVLQVLGWRSAVAAPHGDGHKGGLHQAAAAVVIVGIKEKPEGQPSFVAVVSFNEDLGSSRSRSDVLC